MRGIKKNEPKRRQVWAHRGASAYAPENSLEAFELAAQMGADGVELDVHLSRDGVALVMHDEDVERTARGRAQGRIADLDYAELKKIDVSNGFARAFTPIPTLEQVLTLLSGSALSINIELKTDLIDYPQICERVLAICDRCAYPYEKLWFSSFNHETIRRLNELRSGLQTGLLFSRRLPSAWAKATRYQALALHPHYAQLLRLLALWHRPKNGRLHVWTVDQPALLRYLLIRKVDAVITNRPDLALCIRDGRSRASVRQLGDQTQRLD